MILDVQVPQLGFSGILQQEDQAHKGITPHIIADLNTAVGWIHIPGGGVLNYTYTFTCTLPEFHGRW